MARQTEKAPAYQWYPRDFAADEPVVLMTLEEEGAYRRLLDHQWLHGSIPADVKDLAAICKSIPVARMRRIWSALERCFVEMAADPNRLVNARMERDRTAAQAYREGQRASGAKGGKTKAKNRRTSKRNSSDPTESLEVRHEVASENDVANSVANPSSASASASAPAGKENSVDARGRAGWSEARLREHLPESAHEDLRTVLAGSAQGRDAAIRAIAAMAGLDPAAIPVTPGMGTCTVQEMAAVLSRIASSERPRWHQSLANRCLESLRRDARGSAANDVRSAAERARDWAAGLQ